MDFHYCLGSKTRGLSAGAQSLSVPCQTSWGRCVSGQSAIVPVTGQQRVKTIQRLIISRFKIYIDQMYILDMNSVFIPPLED